MNPFNKAQVGLVAENLAEVDSTNDELVRRLTRGDDLPNGFLLTTHAQTAGKGQGGTSWQTQSGANWTGSILLRPTHLAADAGFRLSQVVALALKRVAERLLSSDRPAEVQIKWPNDLLADDRKLAGVLIQTGLQGNRLAWAVIGIGLNVNQTEFPAGLNRPATSLALLADRLFSLDQVQIELLAALQTEYERTRPENISALDRDYQSALYRRGVPATYRERGQSRTFVGLLRGTDTQGRLLLDGPQGRLRTYDPKSIEFL